MDNVVWYLLAGTRGGETRAKILYALKKRPQNNHQLAKKLGLDYKTVQHHLELLREHNIVTVHGKYGAVYFVSEHMIALWPEFGEIWGQFGKESGKSR